MKSLAHALPASLARRFALAAGGLAAAAVLAAALSTWWLVERQRHDALARLVSSERQFRAAAVGADLKALAERMAEVASSTILATGLVDSVGRETYLAPYLNGIQQINGVPVQLLLTDFQGLEIARNGEAPFNPEQRAWLQRQLALGHRSAALFSSARGTELVALEPMVYTRTASPEGAVLYKIALKDLQLSSGMRLAWGAAAADTSTPVPVPAVYQALGLRISGEPPPETLGNAQSPEYLTILAIALALFSAVLLGGMRLAQLLTRDLQGLEAFSSRLGDAGLGLERASMGSSREVASLARSINRMLDRLHEQHSTLLQERQRLSELAEALQVADQRKDEFLAMLAHELRNPLAPISSAAALLQRQATQHPEVLHSSQVITRQVEQLTGIVDGLLDVSRLSRGLVSLHTEWLDLRSVVTHAVEQVQPLMQAKEQTLAMDLPEDPMGVRGHHGRLVQVLSNLLGNATRYTPEGGHIALRLSGDAHTWQLHVQDNGRGIEASLLPSIFEPFIQGTRAIDRTEGGLGLGLALVRQLVALHGGSVSASSSGPGGGATFTVTLPRAAAPLPVGEPAAAGSPAASRALQVLVVDDNLDAAECLAELLRGEGHAVSLAHNGPDALALAQAAVAPFDACLLDIGLPGMDGYALGQALRTLPSCAQALLVALTGYGGPQDLARSHAAGFDQHLVKPFNLAVLPALLARCVAQR